MAVVINTDELSPDLMAVVINTGELSPEFGGGGHQHWRNFRRI
jgi:hypothetical protein